MAGGTPLFRIHRATRGPWYFSRSGSGRFDPPGSAALGACYFAEEPAGCFLEVFRDFAAALPMEEIRLRRMARIELPGELRLADCTMERARSWGVTAEIHSTPDYRSTQPWAEAFARSGFDGVRYLLRHDPSQRLKGVALFGPAGTPSGYPSGTSEPIRPTMLEEVERRFGIRVLDTL